MPEIFQLAHLTTESELDGQGHVNNTCYLKWMQNAAVRHSDAQGWTTKRYVEHGWSWVVRSHFIEYRRPVFGHEDIVIVTWVADMKKHSSLRKYQIKRGSDGKLVARAETNWAFVERERGTLLAIPEEVASAFQVVDGP